MNIHEIIKSIKTGVHLPNGNGKLWQSVKYGRCARQETLMILRIDSGNFAHLLGLVS